MGPKKAKKTKKQREEEASKCVQTNGKRLSRKKGASRPSWRQRRKLQRRSGNGSPSRNGWPQRKSAVRRRKRGCCRRW